MSKAHGRLTPEQCASLVMEEKTAAFYLVDGANAVHSLDKSTGFYPLAFGLTASGLERLLKLVFIAHRLNGIGDVPSRDQLRNIGHDLLKLADRTSDADQRLAQLRGDAVLGLILATLNDFATQGRYLYMDGIVDLGHKRADPHERFTKLEYAIIDETSETGDLRGSRLWGYTLVGMRPTYVRRRNEFILDRLLGFVGVLTDVFARLLEVPPGYLRIFLEPRNFGKPPSLVRFRQLVNSVELKQWEVDVERMLMNP